MQRVERHIIVNNKEIKHLCWLSKNLYNYANFILRHVYMNCHEDIKDYSDLIVSFEYNEKIYYRIDEYALTQRLAKINQVDYRALPAQISQQVIKLLYRNWNSFFKAIKIYHKNKDRFGGKPKLPKYKNKNGQNIVIFTNQSAKLKDGKIYFPKVTGLKPITTKTDNLKQVRITPQATCHIMEVVYDKKTEQKEVDEKLYLSVDLGVNNLATCITNAGLTPFVVNGKIIKSINQYFNKTKALYQAFVGSKGTSVRINRITHKRNQKIIDYLHKTSRFIVDYCMENKIGNIVIGYNKEWKRGINIGKTNNQKFVFIPFEKLVSMIEYKSEEVGIKVIRQEESYTSKCDSLAYETLTKQDNYLGRRIKRGLFKSSTENLVNADINGALNILRKVIGDSFIRNLVDRGVGITPYRLNC